MPSQMGALIEAAARPYLAAGHYPYYFVRAKLTHDPVFMALLRSGRFPDGARVLDLGCSHAALASLLLAAREQFESGQWPSSWAEPAAQLQLYGIESERRVARRAEIALGRRAVIHTADLREASLPPADVIILIDVLHYLEPQMQIALLERIARSLCRGGLLIMRVADGAAGWRFHLGKAGDRCGLPLAARAFASHYHRPVDEWLRLLGTLGFEPDVEPARQTFANTLIWAESASAAQT